MTRRLLVAVALLVGASTSAWAQDTQPWSMPALPEDQPAPHGDVANQELGVRLGLALGIGGVSPGGLDVGGAWLYRLSERMWFDGEATFILGSSDPACYLSRARDAVCATGPLAGTALLARAGVAYFAKKRKDGFVPFVRGGLGIGVMSLPGDSLSGLLLPVVWAGAGVRTRLTDSVAVRGEAVLTLAPGYYGEGAGTNGLCTFLVQFGMDFAITR